MSDLFNSGSSEKHLAEDFCVVYILYFDEEKGHVPLLIYPDDQYKDDKRFMRPIKYHSVWFLDVEEEAALDHIGLEFKGHTFFGKKILTKSKRTKRRAGLDPDTPETIVIIISLPNDLDILGDELIRTFTSEFRDTFENDLYKLIEYENAKDDVIKTPTIKESIELGKSVKNTMREFVDKFTKQYFSRILKKKSDTNSMKKQKAISYLSLKGIEFFPPSSDKNNDGFSKIKLFDSKKIDSIPLSAKTPISIVNINFIEDSKELEILVRNNTDQELNNIIISITHVKEFFEKEIMNQKIHLWFPNEELLFISPIIPHINEYLFFIIKDNGNEKLVSTRIDINTINKIKS